MTLASPPMAASGAARMVEEFDRIVDELPGPDDLRALRRGAIERFAALGYPTTRLEDWHFTSVAPIAEADYAPLRSPGGEVSADDVMSLGFGDDSWTTIVFVNGVYSSELSSVRGLPRGVNVRTFADAWRESPAILLNRFNEIAPMQSAAFTALNTAFFGDGVVVHVAADAKAAAPIHILWVNDALAARGSSFPRALVVLERNARATVIESFAAIGDATYFTNAVTEVELAEGADLKHLRLQRESARAFHVGTAQVRQAKDSHYQSFSFATGAALSRTNIYTSLNGPGSGATLHGLYLLDGEQHCDHQTLIVHAAPNCFSREVYKGVLDGTSHGVFNGKVYVYPEAQKTDGKQTNNTLLLSERARMDTKPQLEIFADDVKCTHGATIGRIDETALFYLKSRGIPAELARRLLTHAFAADVIEQLDVAAVREGLEQVTLARFTA